MQGQAVTDAVPRPGPDLQPPAAPPRPDAAAELIAPTAALVRLGRGAPPARPRSVMAALTAEAVWIQDAWQLRQIPLPTCTSIQARKIGTELFLTLGSEPCAERLRLQFDSAATWQRWCEELKARRERPVPDPPRGDRRVPEGVSLVRQAPDVPHEPLGRVEFTHRTLRAAERGLQLRAGMRGADAVIHLKREKCRELGWAARRVSGLAIRVEDPAARQRLRLRWYGEEVSGLVQRVILLLVLQAALLLLSAVFFRGATSLNPASGQTLPQALASSGLHLGLWFAWPVALVGLLWALRWPQSLRATGLAVLAATTGRGLTVWVAHLLAVGTTGTMLAEGNIFCWMLADPVQWAFIIAGAALCGRAWRLAGDARQILPQEVQTASTARQAWSHVLLAGTGVYALVLIGWVGAARYQTSTYLLQPGIDPRREHEALLALNEGAALANQGDLDAADRSLQRSLRLWEELTTGRPAPSAYRENLAMTLTDLGWIRQKQGREDEAAKYYARAVSLADELGDDPVLDDEFRKMMSGARADLARLRGGASSKVLNEKDQAAVRKYEEALVKAAKGEVEAERLYGEAIALWEEVLPQADDPEYRKAAVARLALAYLHVGELQQRQGKRPEAEATLRRGIVYGEEAVALDPDRPLAAHNLEAARQMLDGLREQALQEEISKLCDAQRFAEAAERFRREVENQEDQVRLAKDHDGAVRRLAYRLDRFAWFLAHCPDEAVRDAKAAVKQARRATELQPDAADYWYTLGMVQYRNGDWRDSLQSLETVKARAGGFDALSWLLVAMNRWQLKQKEDARAALRTAVELVAEQQRKAEGNALLRIQFEEMRPAIEALRREAENLIQGKGSEGDKVG